MEFQKLVVSTSSCCVVTIETVLGSGIFVLLTMIKEQSHVGYLQ